MAKQPRTPAPKKIRGVYEHPKDSNIWWCQYFADGRRHRECAGTRSNAIALYQRRKSAIRAGEKLPVLRHSRTTFGELLNDMLHFVKTHHKSESGYIGKAALVRKSFGAVTAASLTPETIERWIDARKVKDATFNRYKAFFSLCYKLGMRSGKVDANPATLIFHRREPDGRKRYLSRDEYVTLLDLIVKKQAAREKQRAEKQSLNPSREASNTARSVNRVLAFIVSVFTGMRSGEQFSLLWRQLDFERDEIHLTRTKNGDDRSIPMASVVRKALLEERDLVRPRKSDPVFANPGKGMGGSSTRTVQKSTKYSVAWFERVIADAEIDDYTWHNNRHTFCSWLAIEGVPLKTIQELAGHRSIATTARYAHLCPTHRSREIERMVAPKQQAAHKRGGQPANFKTATKTATGT